mmetsp:Transcript_104184/g.232722  ORF Transcript_104184/g.232722 Transcript_104184/m.232722 type:complete len:92 (-) Transcript_104184:67-342(-)
MRAAAPNRTGSNSPARTTRDGDGADRFREGVMDPRRRPRARRDVASEILADQDLAPRRSEAFIAVFARRCEAMPSKELSSLVGPRPPVGST